MLGDDRCPVLMICTTEPQRARPLKAMPSIRLPDVNLEAGLVPVLPDDRFSLRCPRRALFSSNHWSEGTRQVSGTCRNPDRKPRCAPVIRRSAHVSPARVAARHFARGGLLPNANGLVGAGKTAVFRPTDTEIDVRSGRRRSSRRAATGLRAGLVQVSALAPIRDENGTKTAPLPPKNHGHSLSLNRQSLRVHSDQPAALFDCGLDLRLYEVGLLPCVVAD